MSDVKPEDLPEGVVLKDHTYDGIQEYDQRLPRWWLFTLYGAVVFSVLYWLVNQFYFASQSEQERITEQMSKIEAIRMANSIDVNDDELFWKMSRNPEIVTKGEKIFQSTCTSCHGNDLKGGIGFNLVDETWVHGAAPSAVYDTVAHGAPNGMPDWEGTLGQQRVTQVVAYILSKNDEDKMRQLAASE